MVFYFQSTAVSPPASIYVGKDKVENEELIKFGWEEDFHADNLSSAHVYLRMPTGETWSSIPDALLADCAQLTKANSIEGNKKDNVHVVYTPWSNLMKKASMATGQVSFHDPKLTKRVLVPTRKNPIINRLNKTRVERFPDLQDEQREHLEQKRSAERLDREKKKAVVEEIEKKEREQQKWEKEHAYDELMTDAAGNNQDREANFLEDFM